MATILYIRSVSKERIAVRVDLSCARGPSPSGNPSPIGPISTVDAQGAKEIAVQEFPSSVKSMILRVECIDDDSRSF